MRAADLNRDLIIILVHQFLFQGMFIAKNITLKKKLNAPIRGRNRETTLSIVFFSLFITVSVLMALFGAPSGARGGIGNTVATALAIFLIAVNLLLGAASLIGLKDSWRVGVIERQQTALIENGIYRFSRNPYFVSYLIMFAGYTLLLRSIILFALLLVSFASIHAMVLKEEKHLESLHGTRYRRYKGRVPRYLII